MDAILDFFSSLPGELYVFLISMLPIVELRGAIPIGASSLVGLPFYSNYIIAVIGNLLPVPFILFFVSKFLNFLSRFKIFRPMVNWLRRKANKHSSKVIKAEKKPEEKAEVGSEFSDADTQKAEFDAENSAKADAESIAISENSLKSEESDVAYNAVLSAEGTIESAPEKAESTPVASETAGTDFKSVPRAKMTPALFLGLMLFVAIPLPATGAWTGALIAGLFNFPRKRSLLAITLGVLISGAIMTLASYGVIGFLSILT